MTTISYSEEIPVKGKYDVVVAGGGVAGIAAALAAARKGASVLLLEKQCNLGGLATGGLINYWVPLCNGRGNRIIKGMAEEFFSLSLAYGYDNLPEEWKKGEPEQPTKQRCATLFSIGLYSTLMLRELRNAGVTVLYDILASVPVMKEKHVCGVITDGKSGRGYYECRQLIDATGDADLLMRAGVPVVDGEHFYTYMAHGVTLESCRKALESGNIVDAFTHLNGNPSAEVCREINDVRGITTELENIYLQESQLQLLKNEIGGPRLGRDISLLPTMPQIRTTRHIDGDATFTEKRVYTHEPDSVCVICDFAKRDCIYEVPYGTLVRSGYDNIITCGRSASAEGWGWDVLRVIPGAILTGQAAGTAAVLSMQERCPIAQAPVKKLQKILSEDHVLIHFDDSLIPDNPGESGEQAENNEY